MAISSKDSLEIIRNMESEKLHIKKKDNIMVSLIIHIGQWENGLKHGEGTYTYSSKDIYSGWWQFGKKHGKGTYIYNDTGMRLIGQWN
jgi:hypothetical protein